MGLYQQAQHATSRPDSPISAKKKSGLLDRILLNSAYDAALNAFRRFLSSGGYERGGLLYQSKAGTSQDGPPVFLFSSGFDLTTAYRFSADPALFAAEDSASAWKTFSGSELDVFASLFSSLERESLSSLSFRKMELDSNVTVLAIVADSLLDMRRNKSDLASMEGDFGNVSLILRDKTKLLSALSRTMAVNKSPDAVLEHVKSALDSGKNATLVSVSLKRIFDQPENLPCSSDSLSIFSTITHQIARQTGSSNIVHVRADHSLRIVLFSSSPVDTSLYFHQLLTPLESVFGIQRISCIDVSSTATSSDSREIADFIFRNA